jgi:hypothetical protein
VLVFGYEEESKMYVEILLDYPLARPPWEKEMLETSGQYKLRHKYSCPLALTSEGNRS